MSLNAVAQRSRLVSNLLVGTGAGLSLLLLDSGHLCIEAPHGIADLAIDALDRSLSGLRFDAHSCYELLQGCCQRVRAPIDFAKAGACLFAHPCDVCIEDRVLLVQAGLQRVG